MALNSFPPRKIENASDDLAAFRDHFDAFDDEELGSHDSDDRHDEESPFEPSAAPVRFRRPRLSGQAITPPGNRKLVLTGLIAATTFLGLLALFYGLWALDVHNPNVTRNVLIAGRPIGGLSPEKLTEALGNLNAEYQSIKIHIKTDQGMLDTTAGELGVSIDTSQTKAAALAVGHRGPALNRAWSWAGSILGSDNVVKIPLTVDSEKFAVTINELQRVTYVPPTEPVVSLTSDDQFVVTPGVAGSGLDIAALLATVPLELRGTAQGFTALDLTARRMAIPPKFSDATAKSLADQANTVASTSLTITVNGQSKTINPHRVRTWLMQIGRAHV